MPRTPRSSLDAPYVHVLNRSVRKLSIFLRPQDYRAFLKVLEEGLARYPVRLVAYCVLSNHWHLVLGPDGTGALIRFMQWVTATHAIRWQRQHHLRGQGQLYQGRYHSIGLERPSDLVHACRSVERTAMQSRLVRRAQDWPWCSLAERLQPSASLPLVAASYLMSSAWVDYVNTETPRERSGAVRASVLGVDDVAEDPRVFAIGAKRGQRVVGRLARAHQHNPDAHVERAEHLDIIDPAGVL